MEKNKKLFVAKKSVVIHINISRVNKISLNAQAQSSSLTQSCYFFSEVYLVWLFFYSI